MSISCDEHSGSLYKDLFHKCVLQEAKGDMHPDIYVLSPTSGRFVNETIVNNKIPQKAKGDTVCVQIF